MGPDARPPPRGTRRTCTAQNYKLPAGPRAAQSSRLSATLLFLNKPTVPNERHTPHLLRYDCWVSHATRLARYAVPRCWAPHTIELDRYLSIPSHLFILDRSCFISPYIVPRFWRRERRSRRQSGATARDEWRQPRRLACDLPGPSRAARFWTRCSRDPLIWTSSRSV